MDETGREQRELAATNEILASNMHGQIQLQDNLNTAIYLWGAYC